MAYLVHGTDDAVDATVTIAPAGEQQACKLAALAEHRSQMALSGQRMRHLAMPPERYLGLPKSPSPRTAGDASRPLPWQPSRWLQPWLKLTMADPAGTRVWRWRQAPLQRDRLGRYHLQDAAIVAATPCFAKLQLDLPLVWIFDHWGWCEL